jgi:predicted RNase H-like HicB family nuclease
MKYVYPAVFRKSPDASYTVTFPDIPGCLSEGKTLEEALFMAQSALTEMIEYYQDEKLPLDAPTTNIAVLRSALSENDFVQFVCADIKDNRAVRRTVSIPKWMDDRVAETGLSLSRVLQDTLSQRLR